MVGKLDQMLHFQETALSLRAQRQQLLASNIANADTPNYKARDIDFNKALQGALKRSDSSAAAPGELQKTAISHLASNVSQTRWGAAVVQQSGAGQRRWQYRRYGCAA